MTGVVMEAFGTQYGGGFSPSPRSDEVHSLLNGVEELHKLDEKSWSFRGYKKRIGAPACKASYNSERKIIRVRMSMDAPIQKVMMYCLQQPYGYRSAMTGRGGGQVEVIEDLGKGAVVVYSESHDQTCCCCRFAARDVVALQAIKFLSPRVAIFNSKTIEHPSRPTKEGVYRMHIPLAGFYFEQEGDTTHVESYFSEVDLGGKIGKVKGPKLSGSLVNQMIQIALALPKASDQPPPYLQAVQAQD